MRTYSKLCRLETLEERFDYLAFNGEVGDATFGFDRFLNQGFYKSREWRRARNLVIARDQGNELGIFDYPISGPPHVHHMNPLTLEDLEDGSDNLLNPEYLISASQITHNAIHFGDRSQLPWVPIERSSGDTRLW